MSETEKLLASNAEYIARFPGERPTPPSRQLAVVTCMDSRIDTFSAFGLEIGDAHVIRNAGGLATDDVMRSLAISQRALGTREIVLIHHTQCGMQGFDDDAFRAELTAESGQEPQWRVPGFSDVYVDTREAVTAIRDCDWLPHRDAVRGFVFDVTRGALDEVTVD